MDNLKLRLISVRCKAIRDICLNESRRGTYGILRGYYNFRFHWLVAITHDIVCVNESRICELLVDILGYSLILGGIGGYWKVLMDIWRYLWILEGIDGYLEVFVDIWWYW